MKMSLVLFVGVFLLAADGEDAVLSVERAFVLVHTGQAGSNVVAVV